jgi:feruloyl-CoA synthase
MTTQVPTTAASPKYRAFRYGVTRAMVSKSGANTLLRCENELQAYGERLTDRLIHWAKTAPDRTWMARRGADGQWINISYQEAWDKAQRIGQSLLDMGLSVDRPVAILSENSLEHALIAIAAMTVGVPYCSVSPAYSLLSQDFEKLRHIFETITPGFVYASDWQKFGKAIQAVAPLDVVVAVNDLSENNIAIKNVADNAINTLGTEHRFIEFDDLFKQAATASVAAAKAATGADTIVKFLFTSGSTKLPKGVVNTQRMICANVQQITQSIPAMADEPMVLVDWMPWNHTFGGNHNFSLILHHGGTMYIDDGKPVPALLGITLKNLREIAPTMYLNVPTGFEQIALAMKVDDEDGRQLRKSLFSRCSMFFYAGAALAQPVWDSLFESAEKEIGERIVMTTGLGMTESAPFAIFVTSPNVKAGDLGLPSPGMELKLVPNGDKVEVRYKGPNITPGYWRNDEATQESFDEESFFCTGDAVKWIDENDHHQGLKFDGRIAEDFKLSTGTFVSVGPLRAKIIAAGAPYIQDVVITGLNEKEVGALILPALIPCRKALVLGDSASMGDVALHPKMQQAMAHMIQELAKSATGSASKVARALVLTVPPSIDKGEITDKGSINQRAVLKERAELVAALYADTAPHILKP